MYGSGFSKEVCVVNIKFVENVFFIRERCRVMFEIVECSK